MCLEKIDERDIAEREADRRNRFAASAGGGSASGGEERNKIVIPSAAEERARIRRISVVHLEDHAGIVVEAARDACIEDDVAHAARLERVDTVEELALFESYLRRRSGVLDERERIFCDNCV